MKLRVEWIATPLLISIAIGLASIKIATPLTRALIFAGALALSMGICAFIGMRNRRRRHTEPC